MFGLVFLFFSIYLFNPVAGTPNWLVDGLTRSRWGTNYPKATPLSYRYNIKQARKCIIPAGAYIIAKPGGYFQESNERLICCGNCYGDKFYATDPCSLPYRHLFDHYLRTFLG